jgi:hypothetical protein
VSSFISFALHVLTGWLPSTPWSLKELSDTNSNRLRTVLDEIALGGAIVINQQEIPAEEALLLLPDEDGQVLAVLSPPFLTSPQLQNRQRTKKQLRDLLLRKKMEKDNLIRDIQTREAIVTRVEEATRRPFGEVYFLHAVSKTVGKDRILPILGACCPDPEHPQTTQFLVKWASSPMLFSEITGAEDVPGSTPVSYEWVTLLDLCSDYTQLYLCSFDTRLRTPYSADLGWHWGDLPEKIDEGKGKGKKDAKAKEKKVELAPTVLGVPSRGQDRGVFPPILMKIDPQVLTECGSAYFSLSVNLQADLVSPQPSAGDETNSKQSFQVVDDAVLVLQEIRTDHEDPLVMRVQLAKEGLGFPANRVTFNIPLQRFPHEPVLFWVRLFTRSSVYMSFHSPAPIEVMEAKSTWQNTGGHVWELAGTTLPTYAKTEQLLFRIPIQFTPAPSLEEESGDGSVLFYLHTSNRAITDTLSIIAIDHQTGHSRVLPNINGNCFHLPSADHQITVIGRCFHDTLNIPEYSWRATVLSRRPLSPPDSKMNCLIVTDKGTKQRFYGSYAANNRLTIFRDVITAETTEFPLAIRLSCFPTDQGLEAHGPQTRINLIDERTEVDVAEHLWFVARIYRRADRALVHEYSARSLLQVYLLSRDGLTVDPPHEPLETDKKGAKNVKSDKKKKGELETVDFILEVVIDETKMRIPSHWRSRFPFKFRRYNMTSALGDMDEKVAEGLTCSSQDHGIHFHWQLDVLAGKVSKMHHDTFDLERYAALKNKWEEDAPGRRGRALAGRSYWTLREQSNGGPIDDPTIDKLSVDLSEALDKEETVVAQRERQLKFLPAVHSLTSPVPVSPPSLSLSGPLSLYLCPVSRASHRAPHRQW